MESIASHVSEVDAIVKSGKNIFYVVDENIVVIFHRQASGEKAGRMFLPAGLVEAVITQTALI
jgi:hypothetical protein